MCGSELEETDFNALVVPPFIGNEQYEYHFCKKHQYFQLYKGFRLWQLETTKKIDDLLKENQWIPSQKYVGK